MRVAVVTPCFKPNADWLAQCHDSVRAQSHLCTHFLVFDGPDGEPPENFSGQVIRLHHHHADLGATPRGLASLSAVGQGFDAIAYLDADNWYYPHHIESLVQLHRSSHAPVCTSSIELRALDGSLLGAFPAMDGKRFIDTNIILVARPALWLVTCWALHPPKLVLALDHWFMRNRTLSRRGHSPFWCCPVVVIEAPGQASTGCLENRYLKA